VDSAKRASCCYRDAKHFDGRGCALQHGASTREELTVQDGKHSQADHQKEFACRCVWSMIFQFPTQLR